MSSSIELGTQSFANQKQQFWTLQVTGWLGYALVVFLAIIRPQFERPDFNLSGQIINLFVETFSGFLLSYIQWRFIRKIVHLPLKKTIFYSFTSATTLGFIFNIIKLSSYKVLVYGQQWNEAWDTLEFGGWLLFSLTTMFVWTSIFFIMLYNTRLQREHEKLLKARTAAKDAELQMLRYQLNPHFMFNTMNSISTLIYKFENDKANEMLDKLCEFFRYTLDRGERSVTTLQKELELLKLYISIEKVRFGERLKIHIGIDSEVQECQLPYMLLQPIVENSVKYAVEPCKDGGHIHIKSGCKDNRVTIEIIDDGKDQKVQVRNGLGIGMTNTRARLDAMFNGDYQFEIAENELGGTTVSISFPMITKVSK
ncbi:MAG: histidine kinase [Kangiellaceae bacterium]|nr:histidine kinase [Kangiellaceae bacterium]